MKVPGKLTAVKSGMVHVRERPGSELPHCKAALEPGDTVVGSMVQVRCPKCRESVHARVGPGIDRGACGVEGAQVRFAQTQTQIGCLRCRELRLDPKRAAAQRRKVSKFHELKAASERDFLVQHRMNG